MFDRIPGLRSLSKALAKRVPITKHYVGFQGNVGAHLYNSKRPIFTRLMAQAMAVDPHIKFGLKLIRGPITSGARFYTQCDNQDIKEFINKQITNFWNRGLKYALRSMEHGWYGTEVMYRMEDMQLNFDRLQNIDPLSAKPITMDNQLVGIEVRLNRSGETLPTFVGAPKCFWTVHAREVNRWYGQSRLYGAHIPWYEYNAPEGFRDSRALYFHKCAFNGGVLYYPEGAYTTPEGIVVPNEQTAQRIMNNFRNGSDLVIPKTNNPEQNWEYVPPVSNDISESFLRYGGELKIEMLEALGVPSEVVLAEGTGAYAGRQIPQEAFYSLLQEIVQDIITDFDEQILSPLVAINFGEHHCPYTIECFGLLRNLEEDRGNHKEDGRQAIGAQDGSQGQQTQDPANSQKPPQTHMNRTATFMSRLIIPSPEDVERVASTSNWSFTRMSKAA